MEFQQALMSRLKRLLWKLQKRLKCQSNLMTLIEIVHKLKRKGNKPIIVKFLSHKVRSKLYKSRAKLRNISVPNLFPTSTAATRVASDRIFLNENLTSSRRRIINKASEMRRDGDLISAWSLDGKIYVKTSPEGRPIKIDELQDLDYL